MDPHPATISLRAGAPASCVGAERCELVARARGGDGAALAALWESHRRWVAVVLIAHKPAEVDLEDLMQEVAAALVAHLSDLRDERGFRGWLRIVAVNVARAAARSLSLRRTERLPVGGDEPCTPPRCESGPIGEAERLLELAAGLPCEYAEPLLLKSLRAMTCRQIATMLELPETTVETRITRGRRMLRERAAAAAARAAPLRSAGQEGPEPAPLGSAQTRLQSPAGPRAAALA
ncbi:MAG TPA: sigma-70 family RNA polymerase sigma factor [Phycisphaerales bacterium]|nr:sigma-70 family RNA polymerase sigma factor [Phycisphaerales bacterium]HMP37550.1 sigma-70 family RNA polymerase sigma factor [Phycisphaerales bacterium]